MDREIKRRLQWIQLYDSCGDECVVCRGCGISTPTLRKWWRRYRELGVEGLASQGRFPLNAPNAKIEEKETRLILHLRQSHNFGVEVSTAC